MLGARAARPDFLGEERERGAEVLRKDDRDRLGAPTNGQHGRRRYRQISRRVFVRAIAGIGHDTVTAARNSVTEQ